MTTHTRHLPEISSHKHEFAKLARAMDKQCVRKVGGPSCYVLSIGVITVGFEALL